MIRTIRVLGAALGALIGLVLVAGTSELQAAPYGGFIVAAWTIAWLVVGFGVLPYVTIVPAQWIVAHVQELSTAEFVTAVLGLFVGLLLGLLLSLPLARLSGPLGTWLPLGIYGTLVVPRFVLAELQHIADTPTSPGGPRSSRPRDPRRLPEGSPASSGRAAGRGQPGDATSTRSWSRWRMARAPRS